MYFIILNYNDLVLFLIDYYKFILKKFTPLMGVHLHHLWASCTTYGRHAPLVGVFCILYKTPKF